MASRRLEVEIIGDSRSLERAFGRSSHAGSGLSKTFKGLGIAAAGAGVAIAGGFALTLKRGFDEISEGQKVSVQTAAAIKSTGGAANVSKAHIEAYASALSRVIPIDDEIIQAGQNVLLSFKNIHNEVGKGNDIFDRATKVAADYSARTGKDMSQAALIFGKALEDPVNKSSALSRAGIILTDVQKKQIKAFADSGQSIEAQKVLLSALEERYKGAGEAAGSTMAGQLEIAKNQFDEIAAKVAVKFLPILTSALTWLNTHWPQISRIFETVANAIEVSINAVGPVISRLIGWFQTLVAAARRHWPEIRAVIESVINWFKTNIVPTVQAVVNAVTAIWNRFGSQIIAVTKAWVGVVFSVIKTALRVVRDIVQFWMAVIRGDWGKAWDSLKQAVHDVLTGLRETIGRVLRTLIPAVLGLAVQLGKAIVQGILDGLTNLASAVKDKIIGGVRGAIDGAMGIFGHSPQEVIGVALIDGIIRGWEARSGKLKPAIVDKVNEAIEAARSAITNAQGTFASAFEALASSALSAFDKLTSEFQTKTEKKIARQDEQRANQERQRALREAEAAVRAAKAEVASLVQGEDESPEDFAARMQAANRAVQDALQQREDALFAIQRAADEKKAAQERRQYEASRERQRVNFENQMETLERQLERGRISAQEFRRRVLALFEKYDIPFRNAGQALGAALADGLHDSFADAAKAARSLIETIAAELRKVKFVVSVAVQGGGGGPEHRAAGGPVSAGRSYIVGERRPELFVPNSSGRIYPSVRTGGGGTVVNHFHFDNYLGSPREVAEVLRRELILIGKRNGGNLFGGVA